MSDNIIILWDLDGTLYPETRTIKDVFKQAVTRTLRDIVDPALSDEQASALIEDSRKTYGDSFSGLIKQGFSQSALHQAHHTRLDHTVITRDEKTVQAFAQSRQNGVRHAILTHGHLDWTLRVLEQTGLRPFFAPEDIITTEQIDFLKKHTGPEAFERALDILGAKADQVVMVEDKAVNLLAPHKMGMKTVQVDHSRSKDTGEKPDHVWRHCASPAEAISAALSLTPSKAPGPTPG